MGYHDGYKIRNNEGIFFLTFAVVEWIDVFTRKDYRYIVIDSLKYCQKNKGLVIYAWCLMSNHVHLISQAKGNSLSNILRDFKKHTSVEIVQAIKKHPGESRRDWMLNVFSNVGSKHNQELGHQFWRHDNHPKEIISEQFARQKLDYIHRNPVESEIVEKEEEYIYSSARDYYNRKNCGLLPIEFLV
jgi:putative transposase